MGGQVEELGDAYPDRRGEDLAKEGIPRLCERRLDRVILEDGGCSLWLRIYISIRFFPARLHRMRSNCMQDLYSLETATYQGSNDQRHALSGQYR